LAKGGNLDGAASFDYAQDKLSALHFDFPNKTMGVNPWEPQGFTPQRILTIAPLQA
jgi:hypothetical protein